MNSQVGAVKSADRVLTLLERLGGSESEMSHADLAVALGIPKSSLSHLLQTLLARRWLSYSPEAKTYALGPAITALSRKAQQGASLPELAADVLARLTTSTAESSALNVQKGDESEVAATALSSQRLLSVMRLGDRAPLYATSSGKVILGFAPTRFVEGYLARARFEPITAATVNSPESLKAELAQVRASGFALSREEFTPGVIGIACPLIDAHGLAFGAINLAMPASRYTQEIHHKALAQLRRAAAELVARLGRVSG